MTRSTFTPPPLSPEGREGRVRIELSSNTESSTERLLEIEAAGVMVQRERSDPQTSRGNAIRYLVVGLLVASIASLEFFHELSSGVESGAAVCSAPESKLEAMREMLLHHLKSH